MKKVIDGKTYNTETATLLADDWYRLSDSDRFNTGGCSALYRTQSGNYFLHRESLWEGQPSDSIEPLTMSKANAYYYEASRKWEDLI